MIGLSRVLPRLDRVASSSLFAYGSIALIQAKVLWGIWDHRDLTPADTAIYFTNASAWAENLQLDPDYYPLYQVLWGSAQWLVDGAFALTIGHRVVIAIAVTLLLLVVLRRLLTPGIAWALAVWWAVLPVTYDTLYEVHLFSVIVVLAAVLIAVSWEGFAMRATVFGILLTSALLARSENVVAALAFGAAWAGYEIWLAREGRGNDWRRLAAAAAIPLAVMIGLVAVVSSRSEEVRNGSSVSEQFDAKHRLNTCQTYAYGVWDRDDQRGPNPLAAAEACEPYMNRDFSRPDLSLSEAVRENPGAMAKHFGWNAALSPLAFQISLFDNAWPGTDTSPDYFPIETGSVLALLGSLAVIALLAVGGTLIWRERGWWWREWLRERAWGLVVLGSIAISTVVVMLVTRPRPSYMLGLTVLLLFLIGLSAMAVVRRWPELARAKAAIPVIAALVLIAVPPHYGAGYDNPLIGEGQHLKLMAERLEPFEEELRGPETRLLAPFPASSGCNYVGREDPCTGVAWTAPPDPTARQHLQAGDIDYLYADETVLDLPEWRRALGLFEAAGWRRLAPADPDGDGWLLLGRVGG